MKTALTLKTYEFKGMIFMNEVLTAFLMCLFAGLSTGLGSISALLFKAENKIFSSLSLGFSAGVMIYVSMTEIMSKARVALTSGMGEYIGAWVLFASFFSGALLIVLIGKLIPAFEGENAERCLSGIQGASRKKLMRTGIMSALAIALHNFPEGMATFVSALRDPEIAIPIVVAIAIHNIPEGISVSLPVYRATASKRIAFTVSFLSGLAEPLGALLGWALLLPFMSDTVFGIIFGMCAGIMVYISADEILPSAEESGHHGIVMAGFLLGMAVMAFSLILFI